MFPMTRMTNQRQKPDNSYDPIRAIAQSEIGGRSTANNTLAQFVLIST